MRLSPGPRTFVLAAAIVVAAILGEWYVAGSERGIDCDLTGQIAQLKQVPEASGVAISRRTPGILWSHNDSSEAVLHAFDPEGKAQGTVRVSGAMVRDWEDITAAPCGRGNCLYIADIGDNDLRRRSVTVYRVPEPLPTDRATSPVEAFTATYPDGPHDAEALFVTPDGGLFIVTKDRPTIVYRFPATLRSGSVLQLEQVTTLSLDRVTDADTSTDGQWVAIRTHNEVALYPREAVAAGLISEGLRLDVRDVGEPQGEGVALGTNGTLYLVSEGAEDLRPGTLASLKCEIPSTQ